MSEMKHKPWMKLYVQHWLGDQRLNLCGPASHGLLINLMAMAHDAEPYGFIKDGNGAVDAQTMSRMRAWNRQTVGKAWAELEHNGRIAQAEDGCWYVPRMVKDHAYLLGQSELGKKGGNPTLKGVVKAPLKLEQNKSKNKNQNKNKTEIPAGLDTERFKMAWEEWLQHRREIKKKVTPTAMKRTLMDMNKMGEDRAVAAMRHSIAQGWTGIYEPPHDVSPKQFKSTIPSEKDLEGQQK